MRLGQGQGFNQAAQATAKHAEAKPEKNSQLNGKVKLVMPLGTSVAQEAEMEKEQVN